MLVKSQKGKMSALEGEWENAISGMQEDSVQEETLAVSARKTISVERQHNPPHLLQDRRHKMTEDDLRKEKPPREVVHPGAKVKDRARMTSKEMASFRVSKLQERIGMSIRR